MRRTPTITSRSRRITTALAGAALAFALARPAFAMTREVPNQDPDIQTALGKIVAGMDVDNAIWITQSPLYTNQTIVLTNAFGPGKHLTICPKPGVLARAEILNDDPMSPIATMSNAGNVTFRALDLIRDITNLSGLMSIDVSSNILVERCRLGYSNLSKAGSNLDMLEITYPNHVVIRNCILFSAMPGEFDRAIHVVQFGDPMNQLYLYNNDLANYGVEGLRIDAATVDSALLVMRNNVAVNDPNVVPEPYAYSSGPSTNRLRLRTSHNTAFALPAAIEKFDQPLSADVAGAGQPDFLRLDPTATEETADWVTHTWNPASGDLNPDFYELVATTSLHAGPNAHGVTVLNGFPTPFDEVVADDVDHEGRPSPGSDPHTDRGADQVDPSVIAAAVGPAAPTVGLRAAPLHNPARSLALAYATSEAGVLTAEAFDAQGRRVWSTRRIVAAGAAGTLEGPATSRAGVTLYRLRLTTRSGETRQTSGSIVVLR